VEELLVTAVGYLKLAVEAVGAAIVGFGALATVVVYLLSLFGIRKRSYTQIRLFLGRYLALGLEFQLGSDILGTAVSPTIVIIALLVGGQLLGIPGALLAIPVAEIIRIVVTELLAYRRTAREANEPAVATSAPPTKAE
jgi:uncharacterized membrane protein